MREMRARRHRWLAKQPFWKRWLAYLGVELIAGAVVIAVFAAIGDLEGWPFIAFLVVAYSSIGANKKEYREPQVSDG
jgi:hypothetical protein